MTAEEIRKDNSRNEWFYLREIAAQFAELNHRLQLLSVGNDDAYKSLAVTVVENEDEVL